MLNSLTLALVMALHPIAPNGGMWACAGMWQLPRQRAHPCFGSKLNRCSIERIFCWIWLLQHCH
jgi:hypothetical protein